MLTSACHRVPLSTKNHAKLLWLNNGLDALKKDWLCHQLRFCLEPFTPK